MKRFIAVMIVLMSVCMASAKSVVFTLSNNTKVYYLLGGETNPVMKFVDGKVVVNADTYAFSGIKSFTISEEDDPNLTAIADVKPATSRFDGNALVVASKGAMVKVYDASGKEVDAEMTTDAENTSVSLASLAKGVYIIKIGGSSFKVMKK